jgi:hypothetical protein
MPYKITPYTYKQAKRLGVTVKPSTDKTKKIDVFKYDKKNKTLKKLAAVGAAGMNDYPLFLKNKTTGIKYAKNRRRLYKMRHERDRHIKGSRGYYADQLLW